MTKTLLASVDPSGPPGRDRGAGVTLPTTDLRRGDVYVHTGAGCLLVYSGTSWRQEEIPVVANAAARTAISTNYAAVLYTGFRVRQTDTGNTWEWNGAWKAVPDYTFPTASAYQTIAQTGLATGWQAVTFNATITDSHGGFSGGTYTVPPGQDGLYAVEGAAMMTVPAGALYNGRVIKNGAQVQPSQGASAVNSSATSQSLSAATGRHILSLVAGDTVQLQAYCNAAFATVVFGDAACWLAVERIR